MSGPGPDRPGGCEQSALPSGWRPGLGSREKVCMVTAPPAEPGLRPPVVTNSDRKTPACWACRTGVHVSQGKCREPEQCRHWGLGARTGRSALAAPRPQAPGQWLPPCLIPWPPHAAHDHGLLLAGKPTPSLVQTLELLVARKWGPWGVNRGLCCQLRRTSRGSKPSRYVCVCVCVCVCV